MNESEHLFSDGPLLEFIQNRNGSLSKEISALTEVELPDGDLEELATAVVERYRLEPVLLMADQRTVVDRGTAEIDVRWDQRRMITDTSNGRRVFAIHAACASEYPLRRTGERRDIQLGGQNRHHH